MVATIPPATAMINARNWIHAPTNTPNRLGSSRLPSAPLAKNPTNRNSPANAPTTGTHLHGNRATKAAATTRITRPGGTVGTSIPENIWIANPKAATRRAATVSLLAGDKELGRFIEFLLSVGVTDLAFRGISRRPRSDHHLAPGHIEGDAGQPGGTLRGQVQGGQGHILGRPHPSQREHGGPLLLLILTHQALYALCQDGIRGQTVNADACSPTSLATCRESITTPALAAA